MMKSAALAKSKVTKIGASLGLDLLLEKQDEKWWLLRRKFDSQDLIPVFSAVDLAEFGILLDAFSSGIKITGKTQLARSVDIRWVRRQPTDEPGYHLLAWVSCRVGPLYLNNIQLVEDPDGDIECRWPSMRDREHFWWRPIDEEFSRYLASSIISAVLRGEPSDG